MSADRGSGRRRRRIAAIVIAITGVVAGVAVWAVTSARYDRAVESLARAPVGCDTTLDFDRTGDYLVFVETAGSFPEVAGDCGLSGTFELAEGRAPAVDIQFVDPDGGEVAVQTRSGRTSYDRAGSSGVSVARVSIETAGDHVVRVTAAGDARFTIAIGHDPRAGVGTWRAIAIAIAAVGLIGALVVGSRGRRVRPDDAAPSATTSFIDPAAGSWSSASPTGPPPMRPPHGPPAGGSAWPAGPPRWGGQPPTPGEQSGWSPPGGDRSP